VRRESWGQVRARAGRGRLLVMAMAMAAAVSAASALMLAPQSTSAASHSASRPESGSFSWLSPAVVPANWHRVTTQTGQAVLSYPPSFMPIAGDRGSASAAVESSTGKILAYVNVTPREGDEQLKGFARFRVHLIGENDDRDVHLDSSAGYLAFRGGTGSCVIDDYLTRVGNNHYKEIACFVVGQHASSVVVAAGANADWTHFLPLLRESVASFRIS
jgi:hypothetical protein